MGRVAELGSLALITRRHAMTDEVPEPNPPLSPAEASAIAMLSSKDFEFIDATVLSCALPRWQKVAMVVIRTEASSHGHGHSASVVSWRPGFHRATVRGGVD